MTNIEQRDFLLAIIREHRRYGFRRGDKRQLRRAYANLFGDAGLPVTVYRKAGVKRG